MLARGTEDKEHAMSEKLNSVIAVIGIDIGKNSFHLIGQNKRGAIVLRQKWSRGQVEARLANNGMGAESLAWTLMFVLLPLVCVYYPVNVLPEWLQLIAWALPPTYVFEGMRALLMEHAFRADLMAEAFLLNALYFAAAVVAFLALLESARRAGS